jgi:hypothetical protein
VAERDPNRFLPGEKFAIYTSRVCKGTPFRESISVSTSSSPDKLGYLLLKLVSQSSLGLIASPARAPSLAESPENPLPWPVRSTCGLGGAAGFGTER